MLESSTPFGRTSAWKIPESLSSNRGFLLVWLLFFLGTGAAAYFYLLPHGIPQKMDFRQLYTAGYMLRTNPSHLYDLQRQAEMQNTLVSYNDRLLPFNHVAFEALFFLPFSYFRYSTAYLGMIVTNFALIGACFFLLRPLFLSPIYFWQPQPGILFFSFLPLGIAVFHGQDSIFFLTLCCLVLRLLLEQKDFWSGLLLSFTLFKPQLTLPLAILLIARRGYLFLAGFAVGSTLIFLLCLYLVHVDGLRMFMHMIAFTDTAGQDTAGQHVILSPHDFGGASPLFMPNLHGLLFFTLLRWLPYTLRLPIILSVSLAVLAWAIRHIRLIPEEEAAFAYAMLWALLLSYLCHITDLPLWIIPIAVLSFRAKYPSAEFFLLHSSIVCPILIVFFLNPKIWLWAVSLFLLATALYLSRVLHGNLVGPSIPSSDCR